MNRLILDPTDNLGGELYKISAPQVVQHILQHLRAQKGQAFKACVLGRGLGQAIFKEEKDGHLIFEMGECSPAPRPWCELWVGLSRPQTLKKVIQLGSCLGVDRFVFFKAALSEKSYGEADLFKHGQCRDEAILGLAQSGLYSDVPEFQVKNYLPSEAPEHSAHSTFLLSLRENLPHFGKVSIPKEGRILLIVGPERGLTSQEEEHFENKIQARPVALSASILRVEHAVGAALAQIELIKSTT